MAESYLTKRDIALKFPTLAELARKCGDVDSRLWGLYQKDDEVVFGLRGEGWVLQCSLEDLYERALAEFGSGGDIDTEVLVVIYGVERGTNNLELDLREINDGDGALYFPVIFRRREEHVH